MRGYALIVALALGLANLVAAACGSVDGVKQPPGGQGSQGNPDAGPNRCVLDQSEIGVCEL